MPVPLLAVGALYAVSTVAESDDTDARARAETAAYAKAIEPLQKDGGRVVFSGVRHGLTSLALGELTPEAFREQAVTWKADLERVRAAFATREPPTRLRDAADLFDRALAQYLAVIDRFVAVSHTPKAELSAAITAAVPIAELADRTYDRADAMVQAELRRLGLPTKPSFE